MKLNVQTGKFVAKTRMARPNQNSLIIHKPNTKEINNVEEGLKSEEEIT